MQVRTSVQHQNAQKIVWLPLAGLCPDSLRDLTVLPRPSLF